MPTGNINTTTTKKHPPELIGKLEVVTPAAIQKMLERYEAQIIRAPVEHAIIITSAGDVLHCNGDVHGIPIHWFKQIAAQLEGATVTHNHPPGADENDHTFSDDDFKLFKNFGLARLRGIDEKFIYELNRNPSENELAEYTLVEIYGLGLGFEDYHATIMLKALVEGFGYWRRGR